MLRLAEITISIEMDPMSAMVADVGFNFDDKLEVSLDCDKCQRTNRTVTFEESGSVCHSRNGNHAFPGRIVEKRVDRTHSNVSVTYRIEYGSNGRFSDIKYDYRH